MAGTCRDKFYDINKLAMRERHIWMAPYSAIQQGGGCLVCANQDKAKSQRLSADDYKKLAQNHKIVWTGPLVTSTTIPTGWQCEQGHKWQARYPSIARIAGTGCPECAKHRPRNKGQALIDDYHTLALKRGFKWCGTDAPTKKTTTAWQCEKGHKIGTTYHAIQHGLLCPECKKIDKLGPAVLPSQLLDLERKRSIKLQKEQAIEINTDTNWVCSQNHEFRASFGELDDGHNCPNCAMAEARERKLRKPADYKALAKARGFRWLEGEIINTATPTSWICADNHQWKATYGNIKGGKGCPQCARVSRSEKRRLPDINYSKLAELKNIHWLGPPVQNNSQPTQWSCPNRHVWSASYSSLQQGSGCPQCSKITGAEKQRLSREDYQELAKISKLTWLGPIVDGAREHTEWRCGKNHTWKTSYNTVQQGFGCPHCGRLAAAEKLRLPPDSYKALADSRGFSWSGPYVLSGMPTDWECSKKHRWSATYSSVSSGAGCPDCAIASNSERLRRKPDEYVALAKTNGYLWLGPEVNNANSLTNWVCAGENRHEFKASYSSIQQKHGCPYCKVWLGELDLLNRIKKLFPDEEVLHKARKSVLPWLNRQELDIYVPSRSLGVEHHGIQHYAPIEHFGGLEKFVISLERDQRKRELCAKNGVRLIEFPFDYNLDDKGFMDVINGQTTHLKTQVSSPLLDSLNDLKDLYSDESVTLPDHQDLD